MEQNVNDMQTNYPYFRKFVLAKMKEEFDRTLKPMHGGNLELIAQEEGGLPLDAFIAIQEGKRCTEGSAMATGLIKTISIAKEK